MADATALATAQAEVNAALGDLHRALADLQRLLPDTSKLSAGPSQYLTVAEAAANWRCSESYLYGLINSGELPVFRLGRAIRIRADEIERAFAAEQAS